MFSVNSVRHGAIRKTVIGHCVAALPLCRVLCAKAISVENAATITASSHGSMRLAEMYVTSSGNFFEIIIFFPILSTIVIECRKF